ncbi:Glycosyl transferase family 2 [Glutamicibacter creatinolyticus]|uniref:4,4'-diaponeurosporenoate glycosyltransferase n=1 Tax=Glutamicibacter creatinolyticus TaxID=162496 RepID=A0A5B7WT94_9MICC|nr:glycosyltransferase [Glutamicibacter creatinolyticus]QCY46484.1 Glycosyl transferase family 2 [Glutamicibacter creatinolyticus]
MNEPLRALAIVIPVHNEEEHLPACLAHLAAAMDRFTRCAPQVELHAVLVLDRCTDLSGQLVRDRVRADARFHALPGNFGSVGASRAAGVQRALELSGASPAATWVACSDADSRVPVNWLTVLLLAAARGADAVLGTVQPDEKELEPHRYRQWRQHYRPEPGHGHVHGANLAFNAAHYLRAGGFEPVTAHEDVGLVRRLRAGGARLQATAQIPVVTSGRLTGRLQGGFADYLAGLESRALLLGR